LVQTLLWKNLNYLLGNTWLEEIELIFSMTVTSNPTVWIKGHFDQKVTVQVQTNSHGELITLPVLK